MFLMMITNQNMSGLINMEKLRIEWNGKTATINVPNTVNLGGFLSELRANGIMVYHESELPRFGYFRKRRGANQSRMAVSKRAGAEPAPRHDS